MLSFDMNIKVPSPCRTVITIWTIIGVPHLVSPGSFRCYPISRSDCEATVVTVNRIKNEYHANNNYFKFIIFSIMGFPAHETKLICDCTFQILPHICMCKYLLKLMTLLSWNYVIGIKYEKS